MKNKNVVIQLKSGLDARPVALLVQEASKYDSIIYIESGEKRVNAKSIMGMMSLGLGNGEALNVSADGSDEDAAMEGIEAFLSGKGE